MSTHFSDAMYSWGALFLYVYTGQITFGAIGSQGVSPSEAREARDSYSGGFRAPPPSAVVTEPCSPKSIYCLAEKVCPALQVGYVVSNGSFT